MDLAQYVDRLHQELMVAAEAGGEDSRALAERLTAPLDSATRLVMLAALSSAASEITRELAPGSVEVRLRGVDPEFVVTTPPAHESGEAGDVGDSTTASSASPALGDGEGDGDGGGTARMTLRLPEQFKARIEEAAAREALSVNTWLVRTLGAALEPGNRGSRSRRRESPGEQSYIGWVR